MGNEQSSTLSAGPSASLSTFSFLSNRVSVKRNKGIVTVRDGQFKITTIEEDDVFKRFMEIPKFLPILPNAIGKKPSHQTDPQHRMTSRPIFKFCLRLQDHLTICGRHIITDQTQITEAIKKIDTISASLTTNLVKKKRAHNKFLEELGQLSILNDEIVKIQILLEELVPVAETLNEILVPADRLPELNLGKVLVRTPATSSGSSQQSTPRRGRGMAEIQEITVVDVD